MDLEGVLFGTDSSGLLKDNQCPMDIDLVWTNQMSAGVYATSLITPLSEDGTRQVVVPCFNREFHVLDHDGHTASGFPVYIPQDPYFHTSPLLIDYNGDGIQDFIWVSVDGTIFIINGASGSGRQLLRSKIYLPKLKVAKDWYKTGAPGPKRRLFEAADTVNPKGADQLGDGLTEEARASMNLFVDSDDSPVIHSEDVDQAEADARNPHDAVPMDEEHIYIDPHVLATPALVDINGDSIPDLVIAVSYFFDREEYDNNPHRYTHLPTDIDLKKYVAGGVLVYDLNRDKVVWKEHLDLTTDETTSRAYIYSPPTVVDLDGDGTLEVIVGTSLGLIYALHAFDGKLIPGYPIVMSEIQAQVAAEDINGDGKIELVALDSKGNVLCFNREGKEIWERSISGFSAQGATFGDVNGDGQIDVIIGTVAGHVWALRGDTGEVLPNFPLKTNGRIISPITLVNLDVDSVQSPGLHLVFPSFDGHVYIVDGRTGCTNKIDIGEHSYGMVLVDDILGNNKLQLLVTTMSGNVFCFATNAPYHPLKAWSSQTNGLNGFSSRDGWEGIFISSESIKRRDHMGSTISISFEIVDNTPKQLYNGSEYRVQIRWGHQILFSHTYLQAGRYTEVIPALTTPNVALLHVEMFNQHNQYFYDTISVGFNVKFYRTLKYLLVIPFTIMAGLLIVVKSMKPTLPTA